MRTAAKPFYLAVYGLLGVCHGQSAATESCAIDPKAIVSDACASFSTLDSLNTEIQPTIRSLTQKTDFFSYYRLNLYNKVCPFWSDESGLCGNIACAVNTIDDEEDIPSIWRAEELGKLEGPKAQHPNRQLQKEPKPLKGGLGEDVGESCVVEYDDECDERDYCVPEDESVTAKGDYVSLVDNPERFTGYSGPSAHQVWEAIYRENCFPKAAMASASTPLSPGLGFGFSDGQLQAAQDLKSVLVEHGRHQNMVPGSSLFSAVDDDLDFEDECLEKRVFYRVISGMHASISTHLCYDYLNQTTGIWGPNLECYESRLNDHPDRISNLYFNYALVLRAVSKLKPTLSRYTFCSGDASEDFQTKQKVVALAEQIAAGPRIYDESLMFRDPGLKEDFRNRFRNISRTMDCVGCDKCRLWGKLQTAGYGTALKVLFEFDDDDDSKNPPLRRTELVALVNTLDKISHSLTALKHFQDIMAELALSRPEDSVGQQSPQESTSRSNNAESARDESAEENIDLFEDAKPERPRQKPTMWDDTCREFALVWKTTKQVLWAYVELPGKFLEITVGVLSIIWDWWLGRTYTEGIIKPSYQARTPHDEF